MRLLILPIKSRIISKSIFYNTDSNIQFLHFLGRLIPTNLLERKLFTPIWRLQDEGKRGERPQNKYLQDKLKG